MMRTMLGGTTAPSQRTLRISAAFMADLATPGIKPGYEVRQDAVPNDAQVVGAWVEHDGRDWILCLRLSSGQWPVDAPDECRPVFHTLPEAGR